MKVTRREFVALASALLPACGVTTGSTGNNGEGGNPDAGNNGTTFQPGPEPSPWTAPGTQDDVAFAWGVQTGDVTATSALLSVRTLESTVTLTVMRGTAGGWEQVSTGQAFTPSDDVVQLELTELLPDTSYAVVFHGEDGERRSRVARFRTAPPADFTRVIRFGATSCLGGNRPWDTLTFASDERLDFFVLLGDTIYADDPPNQYDFEGKWSSALKVFGLNDVTASTSVIATWDDHEVSDNWSHETPGMTARAAEAMTSFRRAIPQRGGPDGVLWRKLSWGGAMDVFVLDCRGERLDGNYVSPEQLAWLKQELSASRAKFKIMVNSVPIADFTGTVVGTARQEDRWQGYPQQREELLQHIKDNNITGVLWVAGDFHIAGIGTVDPVGGPAENTFEVLAGPGGSPINQFAGFFNPDDRFLVVVKTWNYTYFEADPATGKVLVRYVGDDGSVLAEETLQVA
ncbi:MAG: alkaline phosphatase D family protein [Myxococcota bacterium]